MIDPIDRVFREQLDRIEQEEQEGLIIESFKGGKEYWLLYN